MRFDRDARRRVVNGLMSGLALLCVLLALLPLGSILYTSASRGLADVVHPTFFTTSGVNPCPYSPHPSDYCVGGIANAIQGTLILLGLSAAIALPLGILTGIYLSEYGRNRFGRIVRFIADVMTGLPSIVVGIFVYSLFLYSSQQGLLPATDTFSTLAGALALSVIMVPIVARTSEEALRLVPTATREAALALGIPRHRTILRVVLSSGRTAVITGALLAVARAAGETAPLIMTDFGNNLYGFQGLFSPTQALPLSIYQLSTSGYANEQVAAWGATLVLVLLMLGISIAARLALRLRTGVGAR